ncbi:GNAT family N-acetyltransferase [Pseudosporangium ferrugineum]|uniref:Acetyltransferase (GNAT) family protein n=1 Tax=Pseudosporangium ferrugineum TaxID=439699 RepID=A0A2T0SF15_9ACTN|nr:GNAT family N-acetyltransferase [Pseudosporangium ferrugineum]PRY32000.1 acetyltransferase (GNAT) family protein [Pseudosporangium ferrugineum]
MRVLPQIDDLPPQLANNRSHWQSWGTVEGAAGSLTVHRSGLPHPMLNGVTRVHGANLPAAYDEARRHLAGVPSLWWVGADSDPGTAGFLTTKAVEVASFPVMAFALDRLPEVAAPSRFRVTEVADAADVAAFVDTYARPMGVLPSSVLAVTAAEVERGNRFDGLARFLGWLDDRPIATAELWISDGVAGLYTVSVDGAHRRRGFGAAVTVAALRAARARGVRVGTLQAGGGERLYRRMGFRTVGRYRVFSL